VARGIRARDEIARSKWTSASYCLQLCDLLAPGSIYAEGTLSGMAAPQASVSLRKADCQFRANDELGTIQKLSIIQIGPGKIGAIERCF
jgi:hypothetical protein